MFSFHEAVLHLRLGKEEQKTLHLWVEQGVKDGVLLKGKRDDYWNIEGLSPYEGVVDKIHSRLAFVKSPHRRSDALAHNPYEVGHKDRVSFIVLGEISGHGRHAKPRSLAYITHVISKGLSHVVGVLQEDAQGQRYCLPSQARLPKVYIEGDEGSVGDKIMVKVVNVPSNFTQKDTFEQQWKGTISEIIGKAGHDAVERKGIALSLSLRTDFDASVLKEADETTVGALNSKKRARKGDERADLRALRTFTIDPADAQDFDDALSLRITEQGHYEVGIHIADVGHYVPMGSALDIEAQKRGCSVYFIDHCIAMLPERLSNDICSLRPKEDRLTYSLLLTMDEQGNVLDEWLGKAIICSQKRFSYDDAEKVLEDPQDAWHATLAPLNDIAKRLRKNRFANGSIFLHSPELIFELDKEGHPLSIRLKDLGQSNALIEEFMLLANQYVAKIGKRLAKQNHCDFVYRVHPPPSTDDFQTLLTHYERMGYAEVSSKREVDTPLAQAALINRVLKKARGKPEERVIGMLSIRSMAKAQYSTRSYAHFGLGFKHYSHFTSPIRRYPDLMAHRILHALHQGKEVPKQDYSRLCMDSTDREIAASEAERAYMKYKQAQYMQQFIGQTYEGLVMGGNRENVFLMLPLLGVEGTLRTRNMPEDDYRWDEKTLSMEGKRHTISVGDTVKVRVLEADVARRLILLEMC